jgi:hypothetical protein
VIALIAQHSPYLIRRVAVVNVCIESAGERRVANSALIVLVHCHFITLCFCDTVFALEVVPGNSCTASD